MPFYFSFKSSSLLFFFIHGIIFSILLLWRGIQDENKSNLYLSGFIFLCTLYIAPFMLGYAGWYSKDPYRDILFYVPFQQLFLMPPLLYFYVQALLRPSHRFSKKALWHYVPAVLYLVYSLIVWITDQWILGEYYFYANERDKDLDPWYQVAGFIFMLFYLFICLNAYTQYRKESHQTLSYADAVLFSWIQRFLIAFLLLLLIRVLFFIINPEWANFGRKHWYYLSFSVLFYYISLNAYIHSVKILAPSFRKGFAPQASSKTLFKEEKYPLREDLPNSTKPSLNPEEQKIKTLIEELMLQEKVFKNPELTLFHIAESLEEHPKKISAIINQGFQMNFNDFVNRYRSQEVIKKIQAKEDEQKTLLGIALEAGFNSKSTFNRAFKKHTQMTPKEYLKKRAPK